MAWAHAGQRSTDSAWDRMLLEGLAITITVTSTGAAASIYTDRDRNGAQAANVVDEYMLRGSSYFTEPGQYTETTSTNSQTTTIAPDPVDIQALLPAVSSAPSWAPTTAYQPAQLVSANNTVWACLLAATSRTSFDATEQANWYPVQLPVVSPFTVIDGGSA